MKNLVRIIFLNGIIAQAIFLVNPFTVDKTASDLTIADIGIMTWLVFTVISVLFFVIYMVRHCIKSNFVNKPIKIVWICTIFIGIFTYMIGPALYYVVVFEMDKTLE